MRLFCFHHAGGSALSFQSWRGQLPPHVEAIPVQLPGRGAEASPAFTELAPLIQSLISALEPLLDQPFATFGHSMGALLAFELAHELRRRGGPAPSHMFVSACRAPHASRIIPPLHTLDDDELLRRLGALGELPGSLLSNSDLRQGYLRTVRADLAICYSYRFRNEDALNAPVTAFGGHDDPLVSPAQLDRWRELSSGPFACHLFTGGHFLPAESRAEMLSIVGASLTGLRRVGAAV